MADKVDRKSDCHCCEGVDADTPVHIRNPSGLSEINYRIGHYGQFMNSMQARLSSVDYPALASLSTREPADFAMAILDACACSLEVLSFYTERFAQEHYLRTADERLSITEMARLIGYRPAPGVAASTYLAFSLQSISGEESQPIEIPVGTRVQSVPGQDEQAQSFETVEPVPARRQWNALPVQTAVPWQPQFGDKELWLNGIDTRLEPGDAILIVGSDRLALPGSEHWDIRVLAGVEVEPDNARTRVTWNDPLGSLYPPMGPASRGVEVHAFRQRTALFGHNAPDPNLMSKGSSTSGSNISVRIDTTDSNSWEWKNFNINGSSIDLDTDNGRITTDSWIALVSNDPDSGSAELPGYTELYRASKVQHLSRNDFGLSSKITRVTPDTTENLNSSTYKLRNTLVLAESERLTAHARPLPQPLQGDSLVCGVRAPDLVPGQALAVSGKRQRLGIGAGVTGLTLHFDDGGSRDLSEGDSLLMAAPAVRLFGGTQVALDAEEFIAQLDSASALLRLILIDRDGRSGSVQALGNELTLLNSLEADPRVHEIVFIDSSDDAVSNDRNHTILKLAAALTNVYERWTVRINANVAAATHGETVAEILGNGDAGSANQKFALKQSPLTYVSAGTTTGRASTLQLRVNDVLWKEVPTLHDSQPDARAFETSEDDTGITTIQFGDGIEGARPPSGENNLRVDYRKGLGVDGNVAAGALTTLLSRPLGVAAVVNPIAASGGEDADSLEHARDNAPLTVLTLERAVSIEDYANFARAFAGIDKSHALWVPTGPALGVFLTVAGVDGAPIPASSDTHSGLLEALSSYGDPLVPVRLVNYIDARFRCRLSIKVHSEHATDKVLTELESALRNHFSFARRQFGQTVSIDEVAATAHSVTGVQAVHVTRLHRQGEPIDVIPRLFARLPVASLTAMPLAAEMLTLADEPIELETLP